MAAQEIADHQTQNRTKAVSNIVSFCSFMAAVISACLVCSFSRLSVPIENPEMLLLASILLLPSFKANARINTLQRLTAFYLIAVLVNQLSFQYFSISLLGIKTNVSQSTAVLLLFVVGFVAENTRPSDSFACTDNKDFLHSWFLTFAILGVHMLLLVFLLKKFYGYGYDLNLTVIGNICLYFLLFVFSWPRLGNLRFRQCLGSIFILFFAALTIIKRLL